MFIAAERIAIGLLCAGENAAAAVIVAAKHTMVHLQVKTTAHLDSKHKFSVHMTLPAISLAISSMLNAFADPRISISLTLSHRSEHLPDTCKHCA